MAEIINTINVEGEDYDVMPRIHAVSGLEIVERCDWESGTFQKCLGVRVNEYGGLHIDVCDNSIGINLSKGSIVQGTHLMGNPLCLDDYYGNGTLTLKIGSGLSVDCDGTLYTTSMGGGGGLGACSEVGESVHIGNDVTVGCNVSIGGGSVIAEHVTVRPGAIIGGDASIGCRASIGARVNIGDYIKITNDCSKLQLGYRCDKLFTTCGQLHIGGLYNNYLSIEYRGQKVKIKCEPQ